MGVWFPHVSRENHTPRRAKTDRNIKISVNLCADKTVSPASVLFGVIQFLMFFCSFSRWFFALFSDIFTSPFLTLHIVYVWVKNI